jgi:hypothetical protein
VSVSTLALLVLPVVDNTPEDSLCKHLAIYLNRQPKSHFLFCAGRGLAGSEFTGGRAEEASSCLAAVPSSEPVLSYHSALL